MEPSDAELMRGVREHRTDAFEALYDRHARRIYATAFRVLHDAAAAEDVVQDIFVRVWRYPDRYVEERGKFLGWLITVARNRSIDELRSRRRRPLNESSVGDPESSTSIMDDTASEQAMREMEGAEMADQRLLVRQALAGLPEAQRKAIELAYYKGLTQAEIAEALNTPLGTVKTRIRLGMQKLRTMLEGRVGLIEPDVVGFPIAPSGTYPAEGSG